MFDFQTQFMFPDPCGGAARAAAARRRAGDHRRRRTATGCTASISRRRGSSSTPRTLILGFAGNAWNSEDAATYLHDLYPDADVVAFHYRGYRPSTGSPSAEALIEDAPLVYDFAVARLPPERTVAVGFSIGTASPPTSPGDGRSTG